MMTLNLIFVANTILVPLDEVYVGFFFGKSELKDRLAGYVGWWSFWPQMIIFFFFVSLILCLWQQMLLLWSPKLLAIHCGRMLGMNILIPPLGYPWLCCPWWPAPKEKSGKIFALDQVINRKKRQSEKQTTMVTTDQPCLTPKLQITHWKICRSAWINTPKWSMTCLINESPSTLSPMN